MCRRGNLTAHQPGWLAGWHAEPPIQLSGQGKPGVEATIPTPSHPCKALALTNHRPHRPTHRLLLHKNGTAGLRQRRCPCSQTHRQVRMGAHR